MNAIALVALNQHTTNDILVANQLAYFDCLLELCGTFGQRTSECRRRDPASRAGWSDGRIQRCGDDVEVFGRVQRHFDSGQRADLAGPLTATVDDDVAADEAAICVHAFGDFELANDARELVDHA